MVGRRMTQKIGVFGPNGRVGKLLVAELESGGWPAMVYAGGCGSTDDPAEFLSACDLVIDFTQPDATVEHVRLAAAAHVPMVIGTTGLSEAQEGILHDAAKTLPIVYAANTSIAVTLLLSLVEQAAARLGPDWDIEILETHHHHKVDAPSGTALALGKAAETGRGEKAQHTSDRTGKRQPGSIGYAVRRGGDVVGEHSVSFYTQGERLELSQMATDRRLFARGALKAAEWLQKQKPGLYSMRDVLK